MDVGFVGLNETHSKENVVHNTANHRFERNFTQWSSASYTMSDSD